MANILIVEDDTDLREGLSFSFSNDGHHVEEVETKKDGLRKIAKGCFDIIFLDCNLPDGTGFSFCVIICYQIFLPLYFPLSEFVNTGGTI